jgi:hypothetical protein
VFSSTKTPHFASASSLQQRATAYVENGQREERHGDKHKCEIKHEPFFLSRRSDVSTTIRNAHRAAVSRLVEAQKSNGSLKQEV